MSLSQALALVEAALVYGDEQTVSADDLSTDLDDLLALSRTLTEIAQAARKVAKEVDVIAAGILGPGRRHRMGDHQVSWTHDWRWTAQTGARQFVVDVAEQCPECVLDLLPVTALRKTGVEKVAKRLGYDPETVVATVLDRKYQDEPTLVWKYQPETGEQHDRNTDT